MERSPYRTNALMEDEAPAVRTPNNADIGPVLCVLWLGSAVRVALALTSHETFSVEPTMALLTLFLVPLALRHVLASWLGRHASA